MCTAVKCRRAVALTLGAMLAQVAAASGASTVSPKRLVEVVDLSAPVVSPDGRQVAFRAEQASVERNTYDSVWYVQDMEGHALPRRVGDGGVPLRDGAGSSIPMPASWSPDGKYLYYRAMLEGRIAVWRAATDGSGARAVSDDPADVRDFKLSEDGRTLRFSVGETREKVVRAEQAEYDQGIHIDETVPVGMPLFRSSFVGGRLGSQRYLGHWFARGPLLAGRPDRWKEVDLGTGVVRDLPSLGEASAKSAGPKDAVEPLFSVQEPEGHRIALVTPVYKDQATEESYANLLDRYELSVLPRAKSRKPIVCRHRLCADQKIKSIQWRPATNELLFTVTLREKGNATSILRWNTGTGEVQPVLTLQGVANGGRDYYSTCGLSSKAMACVVAEASAPPRLEQVDIDTGRRKVLFEPNASLAAEMTATIVSRPLGWKDKNGQTFSGYFFSGREFVGSRRPLFINLYSCSGFLRGGVGDEWPLASLAAAGIATLCIDAAPHKADPIARFNDAVSAVESAVDLLHRQGEIDPGKVGMGGLSFGSETALWVAMESNVLSAVSISTPTVSPLYFLLSSLKGDSFVSGLRKGWGLGTPEETPDQWRRLSVAYNVEKIRAPVLFQMSEEEYIYSLDYTIPMLQKNMADLYVFPEEPHQKFQPRHKEAVYERNLDWFRFWLLGVEGSAPEKSKQYQRWALLRERLGAHARQ